VERFRPGGQHQPEDRHVSPIIVIPVRILTDLQGFMCWLEPRVSLGLFENVMQDSIVRIVVGRHYGEIEEAKISCQVYLTVIVPGR